MERSGSSRLETIRIPTERWEAALHFLARKIITAEVAATDFPELAEVTWQQAIAVGEVLDELLPLIDTTWFEVAERDQTIRSMK